MTELDRQRARMVRRQLARRGIQDRRVLDAMGAMPREAFLPPELRHAAYRDSALPLQEGQTISQPYIVALMAEALELQPSDRVLDIGTGSGYAAAVLSRLAAEVQSLERLPGLARAAAGRLADLGLHNVHVHVADGSLGWPRAAPYDAITVAAAAPSIPPPLEAQLADGGRLVAPIGPPAGIQTLMRVRRQGDALLRERLAEVRFVPLVGAEGWRDSGAR